MNMSTKSIYAWYILKQGQLDSNQRIQQSKCWALPLGDTPKAARCRRNVRGGENSGTSRVFRHKKEHSLQFYTYNFAACADARGWSRTTRTRRQLIYSQLRYLYGIPSHECSSYRLKMKNTVDNSSFRPPIIYKGRADGNLCQRMGPIGLEPMTVRL